MSAPEDVVRRFCDLVSQRDTELLRPLLADGIIYHNIGMPATIGVEAVLDNIVEQWKMFSTVYRFEITFIASAGRAVLTERIDLVGSDESPMPVPLMGTFEIDDDGKITHWRDYFDQGLIAKMGSGQDVDLLVP